MSVVVQHTADSSYENVQVISYKNNHADHSRLTAAHSESHRHRVNSPLITTHVCASREVLERTLHLLGNYDSKLPVPPADTRATVASNELYCICGDICIYISHIYSNSKKAIRTSSSHAAWLYVYASVFSQETGGQLAPASLPGVDVAPSLTSSITQRICAHIRRARMYHKV